MKCETFKAGPDQCVLPWKANVGECPVWDDREMRLYWVDILEKKIHRFDPSKRENDTFTLPEIVPCIALRESGGLVLTLKKNFAFFTPSSGQLEVMAGVEDELPKNRFNDGKCDPQGRFWAGTMDSVNWDDPKGNLFRFDPSREVKLMRANVTCSNGTGWSPDGRTMYHTESFRYAIYCYDFEPETGEITNRREFFEMDKSDGFPDGLSVDAEGYVWSSIVGPGEIHRLDSRGKAEQKIKFPVSRATSSAFGGRDLTTLYVTTSRETLKPADLEAQPFAGSLFAVEVGVRGLSSPRFLG